MILNDTLICLLFIYYLFIYFSFIRLICTANFCLLTSLFIVPKVPVLIVMFFNFFIGDLDCVVVGTIGFSAVNFYDTVVIDH